MARVSSTAGAALVWLLCFFICVPADAFFFRGGGAGNSGGSPNGTFIAAPTASTITDWQGNVWGFSVSTWNPTNAPTNSGYFITKNGVNQQATNTTASASWSGGATSLQIASGLSPIAQGMPVFDNTTIALIGTVQSYSGTTLTLSSGALAASSGSADSVTIGQNTWAKGLLYLNDVVYSQDASNYWQAYSDQSSVFPQWTPAAGDPRIYGTAVSTPGTIITTALSPLSIPSDPGWPAQNTIAASNALYDVFGDVLAFDTNGVPYINGLAITTTSGVTKLEYKHGSIFYEDSLSNWFRYVNDAFASSSAP